MVRWRNLAILIVVGKNSWQTQKELTQDEYLASLYKGEVEQQEIKGKNRITGRLTNDVHFVTSFTDVTDLEKEFQQLKAIPRYESVTEARFRKAVQDGDYTPQLLRLITEYTEYSSMLTRFPTPIASAPPLPPSPVTVTITGTRSRAISRRLQAIASACPRSSAPIPG